MAYALWLPDVLTDAGLVVRPYPGWETRGKSDFAPRGHMLHHTVTKPTTPDLAIDKFLAVTGSATAPPPLCNISTNRDGSVSIIAAGTANHGGVGNWRGISGNKNWIGDEMKNLGSGVSTSVWYEPWVPGQVEAALRAAAACLEHIGADETWMMGHKEYATPAGRKTDPHTLNMNTLRATVKTIMEDEMTPEDKAEILAAIDGLINKLWGYGHKVDPTTGAELHPSAWQLQLRTKTDTTAVRVAVGALELEGVSEDELDERVAELVALISAQPDAFRVALKEAL